VELARTYAEQSADELVFLDISATDEGRKTLAPLVKKIAEAINIPFTVGGGISTREDVSVLISSGADKVSVNTAAILNPPLIAELADEFGSQCVVVAIDAKLVDGTGWFAPTAESASPACRPSPGRVRLKDSARERYSSPP
jgi:cyclase